ncbi:uncharacterized protein BDW43DRAFT_289910 [Aspergillus alliaceus]|uniref:uncharacterized protein n=1 Tax=Petromyces alliaceus TaxID=209559 RepID=UPI0012A702F2|nr:uncharacterized protein BDW43DRAFT_289910 [Aspergillus alliaceus]KAB8228859.1 hypothetical protein BDW43DRAFT_289910 [Aspergillus alliaceus]
MDMDKLSETPELASFVHAVILNGDSFGTVWHNYETKSPKIPATEVDLDELVRCIERIRIPCSE